MKRRILACFVVAAAAVTAACASTGAVPHPFPVPGAVPPAAPPAVSTPAPPAVAPPGPTASSTPTPPDSPARPTVQTSALTDTALSLAGKPYRNGGADPNGFDCSGFTQYVFGHYGIPLPREVKEQFGAGEAVKISEIAPGDLVFFATVAPGASHVGIAIDRDAFVHAPSTSGVVRVERVDTPYWSRRFVGARRVR